MKKIFISLICILSLSLFSCASNNVEEPVNSQEESNQLAPETEETIELAEENEKLFKLPDDIIEPEVITLEPPEEPEPVVVVEEPKEEPILEPIIVEEPAPIKQADAKEIPTEKADAKETLANNSVKPESNLTNNDTKSPVAKIEEKKQEAPTLESPEIEEKTDKVQEIEETEKESEKAEESITPSRSVTIKLKEYVDITYPGSGWIYMGATDGSKNLTYFGRGLGTKDTTFSLQGRHPGTKILHFYKNDHLTNEYLDDYIEVTILDETGSNKTHIAAPAYKQPVPKKAKEMYYKQTVTVDEDDGVIVVAEEPEEVQDKQKGKKADASGGVSEAPVDRKSSGEALEKAGEGAEGQENQSAYKEEKTKITDPNTLLKEAQLLYNEKEFKLADEKINKFLKNATGKLDEGLFLKGQILEAKSEIQNIKTAIAAYETLIKEFPASRYWNDAKKRIVYLKRFYLEVR